LFTAIRLPTAGTELESSRRVQQLRHHSLIAWQRADDLFIKLHQFTIRQLPPHEKYELGSQLRRAGYSVPANIVEGFARRHRRARLHFLNIAESSLAEVSYCVHVARRLEYITEAVHKDLEADLSRVGAPLAGLIRSTRLMPIAIPITCVFLAVVVVLVWRRFS
jgi:four helix bundle protein